MANVSKKSPTFFLLVDVPRRDVEVGGAVDDCPERALNPPGPGGHALPDGGLKVGLVAKVLVSQGRMNNDGQKPIPDLVQ